MDSLFIWLALLVLTLVILFLVWVFVFSRDSWRAPASRSQAGIAGLIMHGQGSTLTVTKEPVLAVEFKKGPDTGYEEQMVSVRLLPGRVREPSFKQAAEVLESWDSPLGVPSKIKSAPINPGSELLLVGESSELVVELKSLLERLAAAVDLNDRTRLQFQTEFQFDELVALRSQVLRSRDEVKDVSPIGEFLEEYQRKRIEELERGHED